jgi:hypothetical protein
MQISRYYPGVFLLRVKSYLLCYLMFMSQEIFLIYTKFHLQNKLLQGEYSCIYALLRTYNTYY